MKYEVLLFDLDGTLTESGTGIINAVKYALSQYGIEENDVETLNKFIGPPLVRSFSEIYGFSEEKSMEAVLKYREYYSTKGLFKNELYEGIDKLIPDLKNAGYKLVLATAKPEMFTFRIMEHFGLDKYFDFIAGALDSEKRIEKHEIIEYALESINADKEKCIMIGDRKNDIEGAKMNGLESLGVLYGYGSREEHEKHGATYIVETVEDLRRFFL